jgi:hypothetical protein
MALGVEQSRRYEFCLQIWHTDLYCAVASATLAEIW